MDDEDAIEDGARQVRPYVGYCLAKEVDHVGQAFQPERAAPSGWKA